MARVALSDGSGWFDDEKAAEFRERTKFDGRNHISKVTGGQWHHVDLYRTKSGKWVSNSWSNWQGSKPSYELISDREAARWFVLNEYSEDELPTDITPIVKDLIDSMEI